MEAGPCPVDIQAVSRVQTKTIRAPKLMKNDRVRTRGTLNVKATASPDPRTPIRLTI